MLRVRLRRPLRLLVPRCRFCRGYTLSRVHKAALYLLGVVAVYLLLQIFLAFRGGASAL